MARPRTIVLTAAGLLLGVLVLAAGAVVGVTQTDRGRAVIRRAVVPILQAALPGTLYVGRIGGTLFTNITIDSLDLAAPDGTPFVRTGPLRAEYDLRDLLARRVVLRALEVDRPRIVLVDYGNDDWNWMRALRKPGPRRAPSSRERGLGDWIRIDSARLLDGTAVVHEAWNPDDTLRGAQRDSAIAFNVARLDRDIAERRGRLELTRRWERFSAILGPSRIADPDSAGQRITVRRASAVENDPPFWFTDFSGEVRLAGDSLWVDSAFVRLPNSVGRGSAQIVWGGGLPMRWDIRLRGDTVGMRDVAWIDPVLPHEGGGSTTIHIRNDPRNVRVMEYILTDMDASALKSRLRGNMTFAVGEPVLRISDVALDLEPVHTDLLRWMNAEPFPYDWRGAIRGRLDARGGPVTRFQVDEAQVAFRDEHVPGAVSRGTLRGPINVYEPAFAKFLGVDLFLDRLDLRTPRYVNPMFTDLGGIVRGSVRLDSVWLDVRFSRAQLAHIDGPGDTSRFTGNGRITLEDDATRFEVELSAQPLSYTTLAKSYPALALRGLAVGPIRAKGTVEDFTLFTALAGPGGELAFNGSVDAFEPDFRATGALRLSGVDAAILLADSTVPRTALNLEAALLVTGESLATLTGSVRAELAAVPSTFGDVPVYSGLLSMRFADGRLEVDSALVESAALRASVSGAVGLTKAARDTLYVRVQADSLGGVRRLAEIGRSRGFAMFGDTLFLPDTTTIRETAVSGTVDMSATIVASLDTLEPTGVSVDASAIGRELQVGASRAYRARLDASLSNVLRSAQGNVRLTLDSAELAGVAVSSLVARAELNDALPAEFAVSLRTPSDATVVVEGGSQRLADSVMVTLNRLDLRVGTRAAPRSPFRPRTMAVADVDARGDEAAIEHPDGARGFSLAGPAHLMLGRDGTGWLDSLVLQHSDVGHASLRGVVTSDARVRGRFVLDRAPLSDVAAFLRPNDTWRGTATADVQVDGTRQQPLFDGSVALRDARFGPVTFGALDVSAKYAEQRLAADATLVVEGRTAVAASATLPIDLALQRNGDRLLSEPLTGRITTSAVDLSLLEAIVPSLQDGVGQLDTDLSLGGTWERPRLSGQLALERGALTVANLGVRLEEMNADIRVRGDTLAIRRLAARSGDSPADTLALSGTIEISSPREPVFDLRMTARQFLAINRPRTASLVVSTTRPVTLTGPRANAVLAGGGRVDEGRIYLDALSQRRGLDLEDEMNVIDTVTVRMDNLLPSAPNAIVQGLTVDNVRVDVGEDVWLRSPEANIKLGGGLRVTRAYDPRDGLARLALSDSLVVQRGTYQLNLGLARPTFEVERGTIRFFGDPDLDPALDISALHIVRQQRPNSNRQDVRIRVSMGGTLNRPTLTLSSADNPPLPESDMLSYLVTGEPAYALFGTTYADQGATLALRLAGSYLSSRLAGGRFDLVQVEPTALNPGEASNLRESGIGILAATRVGVGGQVGQRTFLSVSTGLCGLAAQGTGSADPISLFAQGLGVKLERQFDLGLSVALGLEPASSAQACGRLGASRTFQQTPPQIGIDFFRNWAF